jgi:hypothetical protein
VARCGPRSRSDAFYLVSGQGNQRALDCADVASLRRTLWLGAAGTAVFGLALAVAPRFSIVTIGNQPPYPDYAGARMLGVGAFAAAMLMVMVANHIEDNWWWSWAFAVQSGGIAAVALAKAVSDPGSSSGATWWGVFVFSALFALQLVWGLAKTGTERPPV